MMMEYVKAPYRVATSSKAKKAYIGTVLLVATALVLLGIAALAYPVFYYNYVPKKLISVPMHLQYNSASNPYGIISLSPDLMLEQAYDVSVDLTLPRSSANLGRGNFMVALYALKSAATNPALAFSPSTADPYLQVTEDNVVFSSRRPVLIPYEDPVVSAASRGLFLLWHMVFARAASTLTLSIPMGELVSFANGVRPLSVLVDVQAGQTLQVYASRVTLVARLTGARWFMYNHRILAFVVFTGAFWLAEMVAMAVAWLILGWLFSRQQDIEAGAVVKRENRTAVHAGEGTKPGDTTEGPTVKQEYDDDSDVKTRIKEETPDPDSDVETLALSPRHIGDADDEQDSDDGRVGTGTSFEQGRGGQVRRRVSRGGSA
ncbi:putative adipose-regulatory protein-domain-containing protein [Nemania sp. FL0031]|nr:putative adipose-regulatory protein-domain-containing protein [Nemania sp. FL0031]